MTTQGLSALALEEEASTPARSSQPTTCATEWIGTVTYMSPERLVGDAYSYSADVWSLGIVLIEAAIGRYPFADPALGSSKKLEFWDLLDLVRTGECPAKVLESHGDEWRTLQEFAAAFDESAGPPPCLFCSNFVSNFRPRKKKEIQKKIPPSAAAGCAQRRSVSRSQKRSHVLTARKKLGFCSCSLC